MPRLTLNRDLAVPAKRATLDATGPEIAQALSVAIHDVHQRASAAIARAEIGTSDADAMREKRSSAAKAGLEELRRIAQPPMTELAARVVAIRDRVGVLRARGGSPSAVYVRSMVELESVLDSLRRQLQRTEASIIECGDIQPDQDAA